MTLITLRMRRYGEEMVMAACDKDLLGRTLREGDLRLEVSVSFYEGEDASEEMLVNRLAVATIANLVGERTVGAAIRHRFIDEERVIRIEGVPHAQMVKM
jgi:uncharacterized protein